MHMETCSVMLEIRSTKNHGMYSLYALRHTGMLTSLTSPTSFTMWLHMLLLHAIVSDSACSKIHISGIQLSEAHNTIITVQ